MTTTHGDTEADLVLVVDDDFTMRMLARATLEQSGFTVVEAEDGESAIEIFVAQHPDIVLMDVLMPGMNGFDVCNRLRELPGGANVPVLMMTGLEDQESIERAYQTGAASFITKPIVWPNLGHQVRYVLRADHALRELRTSQLNLAAAQRIARVGSWELNLADGRMHCSEEVMHILGNPAAWSPSLAALVERVHPGDREQFERVLAEVTAGGRCHKLEHRLQLADGRERMVFHQAESDRDETGRPVIVRGVLQDITERCMADEKILLAGKVFENSGEAIVITDTYANILDVNRAFTNIYGHERADVLGQNIRLLKSGRHEHGFYEDMWQRLVRDGEWQGEIWDRRKSGDVFPKWMSINAVRDEQGKATHYVAISKDITKIKQTEERLFHLAHYDPLTNLPNRNLFRDRLDQALRQARRFGRQLALLFLDLDRFKTINDSLGHHAGDQLLLQVGQRLSGVIRECDTVSRLGGDEFTVILADVDAATGVALVAQKIFEALAIPLTLAGQEVFVTASIGISLFPANGQEAETLVKNADIAMYHAKEAGRNTYRFYSQDIGRTTAEQLGLENDLRRALERRELRVYYQPQIELATGRVCGMEALVRWQHLTRGMVSPAEFIPLAEEAGLIEAIDLWVLRTACRQSVEWRRAGLPPLCLAVNISPRYFLHSDMVGKVSEVIRETGIEPAELELEITEGTLIQGVEQTVETLKVLKELGIKVAVDDFGTGYSSLSYLNRLPIDKLKIDQSFLRGAELSADNRAIISAVIAMSHSLGFEVLAEGVENRAALDFLLTKGCDMFQGYFFSRPVNADDFAELVRRSAIPRHAGIPAVSAAPDIAVQEAPQPWCAPCAPCVPAMLIEGYEVSRHDRSDPLDRPSVQAH